MSQLLKIGNITKNYLQYYRVGNRDKLAILFKSILDLQKMHFLSFNRILIYGIKSLKDIIDIKLYHNKELVRDSVLLATKRKKTELNVDFEQYLLL